MSRESSLKAYRAKRDFERTDEPSGGPGSADDGGNLFVIQKHHASRLHYDFRLEVDGVLKSWAVPKGPSTDPRVKRLALPTEDHPVAYADFEGTIPAGSYGAGTVLIWDRGTYENLARNDQGEPISMADCLQAGRLKIELKGSKIRGGYALIRTDGDNDGRWLLVKMDDQAADARRNPVSTEPRSVVSGRDLHDLEDTGNDA